MTGPGPCGRRLALGYSPAHTARSHHRPWAGITKTLLGQSTTFHQDATCASCHRTVAAIVYHHT